VRTGEEGAPGKEGGWDRLTPALGRPETEELTISRLKQRSWENRLLPASGRPEGEELNLVHRAGGGWLTPDKTWPREGKALERPPWHIGECPTAEAEIGALTCLGPVNRTSTSYRTDH
jgi:hypothetical protein